MSLLEIQDISMNYHSLKGETKALTNINFDVSNEDFICILGPSGCGKSTLLNILSGILEPSSGIVLYNGEDIFKMDADYRNILGYLPQEFGVYKNFTAREFLQYIGALKGLRGKYLNSKIGELLDLVGLYDVRNKSIGKFSGGMKRRVGIAQVLLNDPKIKIGRAHV